MIAASKIIAATPEHLGDVQRLAHEIWYSHYPGIITHKQIAYMLARDYAIPALEEDLANHVSIDLLLVDDKPTGFAAYGPAPADALCRPEDESAEAKLHKLYLTTSFHGQGLGSTFLQHIEDRCRTNGIELLSLSVNKHNHKAIRAYRRNGFEIVRSIFVDIGDGFYMDDYVMAKDLVTE